MYVKFSREWRVSHLLSVPDRPGSLKSAGVRALACWLLNYILVITMRVLSDVTCSLNCEHMLKCPSFFVNIRKVFFYIRDSAAQYIILRFSVIENVSIL